MKATTRRPALRRAGSVSAAGAACSLAATVVWAALATRRHTAPPVLGLLRVWSRHLGLPSGGLSREPQMSKKPGKLDLLYRKPDADPAEER